MSGPWPRSDSKAGPGPSVAAGTQAHTPILYYLGPALLRHLGD